MNYIYICFAQYCSLFTCQQREPNAETDLNNICLYISNHRFFPNISQSETSPHLIFYKNTASPKVDAGVHQTGQWATFFYNCFVNSLSHLVTLFQIQKVNTAKICRTASGRLWLSDKPDWCLQRQDNANPGINHSHYQNIDFF